MYFFVFLGLMNLLLVENQSAQEFRVKGGSQRISQKLVSKIGPHRVLLKHTATKIEQTVVLIWDPKFLICPKLPEIFHAMNEAGKNFLHEITNTISTL